MGITNLRYGLEAKLAKYRGELEEITEQIRLIEAGLANLPQIHVRRAKLLGLIAGAELIILDDNPDWQSSKIKPVRARKWNSPFKSGEISRTALTVLREADAWLRPKAIAEIMLEQIGHDPLDRASREKLTNSVSAYLKSHENTLVESRGDFAKEWRVIR